MRRIGGSLVVAVALGAALTLSALPASAGRAAPATGVLLSTIQQRAATSISLRRTTIEQLESLVAGTRSFAGDDGSMLAGRLRSDAAGLAALGSKVASDQDARTAWADYVAVFDQYRIYALVDPVVHFVRATDVLVVLVTPRLVTVQRTLRSLLRQEQRAGKNVSAATKPMKDLGAQLHTISSMTDGLSARLLALTPADWNADHAVLGPPLTDLQKARVAVGRAVADAQAVEVVLQ